MLGRWIGLVSGAEYASLCMLLRVYRFFVGIVTVLCLKVGVGDGLESVRFD